MVERVLNLYKEIGETPLERMERFVRDNPQYENIPMTYAGRLDPMAEGVLVVLTGDEVHKKHFFNALSKEYESEFLFGVSTDTFDVLGKIVEAEDDIVVPFGSLLKELAVFEGPQQQKLPPFASEKMGGIALWRLAKDGKIGPDDTPAKEITIKQINLQKLSDLPKEMLDSEVTRRIKLVKGDFRQKELLMTWEETLRGLSGDTFQLARVHVECSTGTYIRRIAYDLGQTLGIPTLAYSILRTRVGSYTIKDARR